jgi:hypothetical protein
MHAPGRDQASTYRRHGLCCMKGPGKFTSDAVVPGAQETVPLSRIVEGMTTVNSAGRCGSSTHRRWTLERINRRSTRFIIGFETRESQVPCASITESPVVSTLRSRRAHRGGAAHHEAPGPRLVARPMPRSPRDDPDESTGRRGSSSDSSAADWRRRLAPGAGGAANGTPSFLTSPADRGGRLGQPVRELLLTDPRTEESPRRRAEQPACRGSRTYSVRMKDGTRISTTVAATTMLEPRVPADVPFLGWPS